MKPTLSYHISYSLNSHFLSVSLMVSVSFPNIVNQMNRHGNMSHMYKSCVLSKKCKNLLAIIFM